jgi:hypothetical protein
MTGSRGNSGQLLHSVTEKVSEMCIIALDRYLM